MLLVWAIFKTSLTVHSTVHHRHDVFAGCHIDSCVSSGTQCFGNQWSFARTTLRMYVRQ
jgi:hypothetical protein